MKSSRIMIAVLAMTGLLLTTGCTDSSAPSSVPLSSSASTNKTQTTTVPTQIPDESEESYVATITKKGVGSSRYGYQGSKRLDKLTDLGVSWYYNWGITIPDQTVNMEYVPMMWGANTATVTSKRYSRDLSRVTTKTFWDLTSRIYRSNLI